MKTFNVPIIYRSPLISAIKQKRKQQDRMKKDFTPTLLDFGPLRIQLARHFGFCYGVENAIEIAFKTVDENEGKRIFLLSEMIHNPQVNNDLLARGVQFLMDTSGRQLIPWNDLRADDIVIIPAFGTTLEIEAQLQAKGITPLQYNTTCPFVERVWNKADLLARETGLVGEAEHGVVPAGGNAVPGESGRHAGREKGSSPSSDVVAVERGDAPLLISAHTGAGLDALRARLLAIAGWTPGMESPWLARERHVRALEAAREHLQAAAVHAAHSDQVLDLFAEELRLAHEALCGITGEFTSDDLLGEIFSRFCIGK